VACLGGGETGRALVVGLLRDTGNDPSDIFTGTTYAPTALSDAEKAANTGLADLPEDVGADCPAWLWPMVKDALGTVGGAQVFATLRDRAPLTMRANLRKSSRATALAALADCGITGVENPLSDTAITLPDYPRNLKNIPPYTQGLVELQDAASQAIVDALPVFVGGKILDYCAGGGGKTLAIAGRMHARFTAHDAFVPRMKDLPARAARAGVDVEILAGPPADGREFDLVFCDAPCSGSGSWRRDPEGKWGLSRDGLRAVCALQQQILQDAAQYVTEGGFLAYATCSFLPVENKSQIENFLASEPNWSLLSEKQFLPNQFGDGFYIAIIKKHR